MPMREFSVAGVALDGTRLEESKVTLVPEVGVITVSVKKQVHEYAGLVAQNRPIHGPTRVGTAKYKIEVPVAQSHDPNIDNPGIKVLCIQFNDSAEANDFKSELENMK